jgi:hypothetical protein
MKSSSRPNAGESEWHQAVRRRHAELLTTATPHDRDYVAADQSLLQLIEKTDCLLRALDPLFQEGGHLDGSSEDGNSMFQEVFYSLPDALFTGRRKQINISLARALHLACDHLHRGGGGATLESLSSVRHEPFSHAAAPSQSSVA